MPHNVFQVLTEVEAHCASGNTRGALRAIREYRRRAKVREVGGQYARQAELRAEREAQGLCRCGRSPAPAGHSCRQCRLERAAKYHAKKTRPFSVAA